MSTRTEQAPSASVVAVVLVDDVDAISDTLTAIDAQVYGPRHVTVVGRQPAARAKADAAGVGWSASLVALLDATGPEVSHIWILRSGAVPRPDALRALVTDSERAGSPLAGSKILDRDVPERLVSVGVATDVFDIPYLGLDDGEVDAGQYDVVRDVASVDGTSLLVRRDLAKGLGGFDELLAPQAAAIDLSQRARLRAARVVVAPSSEVEFPYKPPVGDWREQAGSIRAMAKAYGLLTLVWALPLAFLIGLVEAIVAPLLGRWTLFAWMRAWSWNLLHAYSTLRGRIAARRGDVVSDAELYRYQVRGSVQLRSMVEAAGARLTRRLGPEERSSLVDLGREFRRPAFLAGLVSVFLVVVATRSVWANGFPASGYSLPLPSSGADALGAYAGGWNPGGFGSTEPLMPLIGVAGALQVILFDNAGLTTGILVLGAFLGGLWGTTKLMRTWDVGPIAGILAGVALMAGPAARALAADTGVGTLLALGALPWALRIPLLGWPRTWWQRLGRIASAALVTAVLALLSPQLIIVPAASVMVWAILNLTERRAWISAAVAVAGSLIALPALLPWLDAADLGRFLGDGAAFWDIGIIPVATFAVAFVATVVAVPSRLALVTGWGGTLAAAGLVVARSGDYGPGREVEHLGLAVASMGTAVVVGVAIEGVRRVVEITGWRRILVGFGAVAATVLATSALLVVIPGRAGLPAGELADRVAFVGAADGDPASSRILVIGPQDVLPGESRTVRGAGYRVVSAPLPEMWEAWLPEPAAVDAALEADLEAMIDGDTFRAGEVLAPYGIRWVISLGDTPLEEVFASQLDLLPLGTREGSAFIVEGDRPVRATVDDGTGWSKTTSGYEGDPGSGRVLLAESGDLRWGPDPELVGPIVSVSTSEGEARFDPIDKRRTQAWFAGGFVLLLAALSWVGRRRS